MHADRTKTLRLLKTAKGQIEGLIKMIESDRYCIDISNQILATQSILKKVNFDILKRHFSHCLKETIKQGDEKATDEKLEEIVTVLNKLAK